MLKDTYTFNSFTTSDMAATKHFYVDTLGLKVIENEMETFEIKAWGSNKFLIYLELKTNSLSKHWESHQISA